ncbi:DUF4837 family protein [Luteibaculum oceani]|uniref:DUF4837 family protein n=1 Tax=Luteibaculum oceani TaxID=1294296 RepID=A0A5C6VIR0_9FLAO|nr:DUF4837 family protein [Luteibaculum oceani]TXC85303.1 DUF4837 family protein [Luteibaculum oceani]
MLETLNLVRKSLSELIAQKAKSPLLLLSLSFIFLVSCEDEVVVKPSYTGTSGEIVVIVEKALWTNQLEDSVKTLLQPNFPMLPQAEAMFNVLHYDPQDVNQLIERHRNTIKIEVGTPRKPGLNFIKDDQAKGQLTVLIRADDHLGVLDLLSSRVNDVIELIREEERKRYQNWLSLHREKELEKKILDEFGYAIILPKGTRLVELKPDFVRLDWEREKIKGGTQHFINHGILLYKHPYDSDSIFNPVAMRDIRNQNLKRIPGPRKGTHMTTQNFFEPELTAVSPNPGFKYAADFRALWRTTESFLGGPFVSFVQVDKSGSELIISEVFVLAPKFNKREFIKEAEAIAYSVYSQ